MKRPQDTRLQWMMEMLSTTTIATPATSCDDGADAWYELQRFSIGKTSAVPVARTKSRL